MTASDYLKACGKDVADAYARMRHTPESALTQATYRVFIGELLQQFDSMRQAITVRPWTDKGQPYADSAMMFADIRDKRHLYIYMDADTLPANHPMAERVDVAAMTLLERHRPAWTANHVFRAVHDYYGHALNGYTFSPTGEECAFRFHRRMFTRVATWALACETRAQSCAFNYGPHAHIARPNRPYPDQKAGILPSFVVFSE